MLKNKYIFFLFILLSTSLFAKEKTFIREYAYEMKFYDTKETARAVALTEIKNILFEEVGIFVTKEVGWGQEETIIDGKYTMRDIYEANTQAVLSGVTKTTIIDETWADDLYLIRAEITFDPDDVSDNYKKRKRFHYKNLGRFKVAATATFVWASYVATIYNTRIKRR